jgi:hypothetical protein
LQPRRSTSIISLPWEPQICYDFAVDYSGRHQTACFKATEGLPPPLPRGSKSPVQRCYAASSELSSLTWAPLFVLQRCRILLWPWSMHFGDGYYNPVINWFVCTRREWRLMRDAK